MSSLPSIELCPLCGLASHAGRCSKPPRGEWWCSLCLADVLKTPDGDLISMPVLLAAGVHRTSVWCKRCGVPICGSHRHPTAHRVRCNHECRTRLAPEVDALERFTATYSPGFVAPRCSICATPAYVKGLCSRHYHHVRSGRVVLPLERLKSIPGQKLKWVHVYFPPDLYAHAHAVAADDGYSLSRWVSTLVLEELNRRAAEPPTKSEDPKPAKLGRPVNT